ncbi:hypothetical protein TNCT_722511 [Trichonephila clavata]|uniref:Uncharacterized protein n=1 Tax=Trichonephila clavata TaxID=2740835 RepID=A0A8X6FEI6_TRICU|nr:hypothetical protein TNCT_722511 [Trichonephila clavata]
MVVRTYNFGENISRPGTFQVPDLEVEDLKEPHRLNQAELRNLDLPKQKTKYRVQTALMESTPTRRQYYRVQGS